MKIQFIVICGCFIGF